MADERVLKAREGLGSAVVGLRAILVDYRARMPSPHNLGLLVPHSKALHGMKQVLDGAKDVVRMGEHAVVTPTGTVDKAVILHGIVKELVRVILAQLGTADPRASLPHGRR